MQQPAPRLQTRVVHDHDVQFYEAEAFLFDAVGRYIAPGIRAEHPVIVIATPAHRDAFISRLAAEGLDADGAERKGLLTFVDARETLATFMVGQNPDPVLFDKTVGALIEKAHAGREHLPLRAFGEMVELLWRDGNPEGAIRLEQLWNELAMRHSFSLFCAYAMANFDREDHTGQFQEVCVQHRLVFPTELYQEADSNALLREITFLQQKARALETEIAQRKQLETVLRDALTARQEAEALVRQSEQELKDFCENAVEGLHWVGSDGTILWANQAELDLLGYAREEYVGHHIAEFHVEPEVIDDLLARLQRNETIHNYEARLRRKDGAQRTVLINSNVLWRGGQFVHTCCFTRDITERKAVEAERDRLLVSERAARQEAENANQLKDQFLATVSHELRSPLTAILGWVEIVKSKDMEPTVARAFEVIDRNAGLQLQLVNDLLNASRMLTSRLTITRAPLDFAKVVNEVVESFRPKAFEKDIDLQVFLDPSVGEIQGDEGRLQQVVGNLLANAVKFTPNKGRIDVRLERSGDSASLAVQDSGEGIAPDFLPHVFERFRQGETGLARKHDGLGLGLAIVQHVVEAHGGSVQAHSDGIGCGATFVVLLPLAN